ncbi:hypothetical protein G7046_g9091 [Stylonectria norvegica]|nr:hypothetical protein G7046_g9091 [Stylonectria norvegica]
MVRQELIAPAQELKQFPAQEHTVPAQKDDVIPELSAPGHKKSPVQKQDMVPTQEHKDGSAQEYETTPAAEKHDLVPNNEP